MSRLTLEEPIEMTPEEEEESMRLIKESLLKQATIIAEDPIDDPDVEQIWNTPITLI